MDILEFIKQMQEMYGEDAITTADKINRPEPKKEVKEIELFNEFNTRNPQADGGRIGFDGGGSPLQRLRQEIVDSMRPYAPGYVTEDQLQLVVKDITLDMTAEQAQESAKANFIKLFGMAEGGRAGYNDGQLVTPSVDGSRPGYGGKVESTKHLGTTDKNYGGVYEETYKGGTKSYYGKYVRDGQAFKKNFKDKDDALKFVTEGRKKPSAKSVIDIQSEGGTLLEKPKYKNNLARAMNEVNALQEKGYGNIGKIVKKYQKIFTQKVGSKTKTGKTVKKGVGSTEYKAITFAIREQAKKLGIQSIDNSNVIKALDAYSKIKNPKRGDIPKILKKYNVSEGSFNRYLQEDKLNLRKKIPLQFGSEAEKKKYYYRLRRDAIAKFSSKKFERFFSAPETALVQKSHLGDLYNQYVRTGNLGYAPNLINQETLKDVDAILKEYNEQINNLFKNKPKGYRNKIDLLNQKGNDLAAATQGYKKFTGRDPLTGKEFTINFSKPSQELDPGNLYGNKKLSELTKADKITGIYDPKTETYKKVNIPLLEDMKKQSMKAAKLSKKETKKISKEILSQLEKLGCGNAAGGRILMSNGGATLTKCANEGTKRLEQIILRGGANKTEQGLAKKILQAGRGLKLSGIFGPAALAFSVATEAGFVGYDMISQGKTFREAVGDSVFNYALGDRTKIDSAEERYKKYAKQGFDVDKIRAFEKNIDRIDEISSQYDNLYKKANVVNIGGPRRSDAIKQKQQIISNKAKAELPLFTQDLFRTGEIPKLEKFLKKDYVEGMKNISEADRLSEIDRLSNISPLAIGKIRAMEDEKRLRELKLQNPDVRAYMGPYPTTFGFASGGLASLTDTIPPESGPMSQGLRSLYNNDMDY